MEFIRVGFFQSESSPQLFNFSNSEIPVEQEHTEFQQNNQQVISDSTDPTQFILEENNDNNEETVSNDNDSAIVDDLDYLEERLLQVENPQVEGQEFIDYQNYDDQTYLTDSHNIQIILEENNDHNQETFSNANDSFGFKDSFYQEEELFQVEHSQVEAQEFINDQEYDLSYSIDCENLQFINENNDPNKETVSNANNRARVNDSFYQEEGFLQVEHSQVEEQEDNNYEKHDLQDINVHENNQSIQQQFKNLIDETVSNANSIEIQDDLSDSELTEIHQATSYKFYEENQPIPNEKQHQQQLPKLTNPEKNQFIQQSNDIGIGKETVSNINNSALVYDFIYRKERLHQTGNKQVVAQELSDYQGQQQDINCLNYSENRLLIQEESNINNEKVVSSANNSARIDYFPKQRNTDDLMTSLLKQILKQTEVILKFNALIFTFQKEFKKYLKENQMFDEKSYEIEQIGTQIGTGSQGKVFNCRDDTRYIVKLENLDASKGILQKKIQIYLNKENVDGVNKIIKLYSEDNKLWTVMEKGDCTLQQLQQSGQMSMDLYLRLEKDLKNTIEQLHKRKIVHRDIKPANIVYFKDQKKFQLIDFDSAQLYEQSIIERYINFEYLPPLARQCFASKQNLQYNDEYAVKKILQQAKNKIF